MGGVTVDFVELIALQVDKALTSIMHTVRTSPINTALLSTLNHAEFVASNPIRDLITGIMHKTARQVAANAGLVAMAHVAQAGMGFFDLHKLRNISNGKPKEIIINDSDVEVEVEGHMDTIQRGVNVLVCNKELPSISDLVQFLKKSFIDMTPHDFACLQSMLPDLYIFQEFTRPLDTKEEVQIQRLTAGEVKKKVVDLTKTSDDSDDDGISTLDFKKVSTKKLPVNSSNSNAQSSREKALCATTPASRLKTATPTSQKAYSNSDDVHYKMTSSTKTNSSTIGMFKMII